MPRPRLLFLILAMVGLVGRNRSPASPPQPKEGVVAAGEIGSRLPEFSVKDYPLAVAVDDLKQRFGGIEGLPTTMLYDLREYSQRRSSGSNTPTPSNLH
jgi:hypothetical protein